MEKYVAHVDDVGPGPVNQRIAIGVGARNMDDPQRVAVQVKAQVAGESHHGQPRLGKRLDRASETLADRVDRQPAADIVLRDDNRPATPERLVPARVIAVPMRVDQECDRVGIERLHRSDDLGRKRRELIVDQDVAVDTVTDPDVAARAEQNRHARRNLLDLDLDLRHILLRRSRGSGSEHDCSGDFTHGYLSL